MDTKNTLMSEQIPFIQEVIILSRDLTFLHINSVSLFCCFIIHLPEKQGKFFQKTGEIFS